MTLGAAPIEAASGITVNPDAYTSNLAKTLTIKSPGVLLNDRDAAGYPLTVSGATSTPLTLSLTGGGSVSVGPDGGFTATVPAPGTYTFTLQGEELTGYVSSTRNRNRNPDLPGSRAVSR